MLVIKDSISDDLYKKCVDELESNVPKHCWQSSSLNWDFPLKHGVVGSCIYTLVSDDTQKLLEEELKSSLPKYRKLICQYYIWQNQAGIGWHNDAGGDRVFGATLYLNQEWNPTNGGWFIWEDDDGYHTILPKKKLLVVNGNYEHHCVTPVSLGVRCTVQIWGES